MPNAYSKLVGLLIDSGSNLQNSLECFKPVLYPGMWTHLLFVTWTQLHGF